MATTSRPAARPSRPITVSMNRLALVLREPRQTRRANILREKTSMDLSSVSVGLTQLAPLIGTYWVFRSCCPLALKAINCRSGPVWTDVFYSSVGSSFILNISRSSGICSSVSKGPALKDGGSTVGTTDCFRSSFSTTSSSFALPSSATASPKTRLSERHETRDTRFGSLLCGLFSLDDLLTRGTGAKSLYCFTCKKSPSMFSSLAKQLLPFSHFSGQIELRER